MTTLFDPGSGSSVPPPPPPTTIRRLPHTPSQPGTYIDPNTGRATYNEADQAAGYPPSQQIYNPASPSTISPEQQAALDAWIANGSGALRPTPRAPLAAPQSITPPPPPPVGVGPGPAFDPGAFNPGARPSFVAPPTPPPPPPLPLPPDFPQGFRAFAPRSRGPLAALPGLPGLPGGAPLGPRPTPPLGPRPPLPFTGRPQIPLMPAWFRGLARSPYAQFAGAGSNVFSRLGGFGGPGGFGGSPEFLPFEDEQQRRALGGPSDLPAWALSP
ncbi:MAG: hypothetical protein ACRDM7_05360 [Thermoleophilaceae bacterium]